MWVDYWGGGGKGYVSGPPLKLLGGPSPPPPPPISHRNWREMWVDYWGEGGGGKGYVGGPPLKLLGGPSPPPPPPPPLFFEDNSSTHYYLAIIPKLIKWRQCFSIKVICYHVYDQNKEFRMLIPYFGFLIQFQIPFKPHTTAGPNKLTHCIFNVWYTWNF